MMQHPIHRPGRKKDVMHWTRLAFCELGICLLLASTLPAMGLAEDAADKKVGAEKCGECHKKEFKAWNVTKHSQILSDAEDEETIKQSEEIPERLGIDDIEVAAECSNCHFTYFYDEDGDEQLTSVDCESCHGYAREWVDIHSDYGVKNGSPIEDAEDEDPAHREARWKESTREGMLRPSNIYGVASNCLNCHKGPSERVVNIGGHTPGSKFELVSWLQGEVRHNFHRTNQASNAELSRDRKRQLYVLGRALDLEYSLRGLSSASADGPYFQAMKERVNGSKQQLEAVSNVLSLPELTQMLGALAGANLKPNQKAQLSAIANQIGQIAEKFARKHDGSQLAAVDTLIPQNAVGTTFDE